MDDPQSRKQSRKSAYKSIRRTTSAACFSKEDQLGFHREFSCKAKKVVLINVIEKSVIDFIKRISQEGKQKQRKISFLDFLATVQNSWKKLYDI